MSSPSVYRGRIAPSPTGYLHLGHARTFWIAQERARASNGTLILRNDDLDRSRVRPEYVTGFIEDLQWFGFHWSEGPDIGGPNEPYDQSKRLPLYYAALQQLQASDAVYPCTCSRQDVLRSLTAPHQGEEEPIYPGTCRNRKLSDIPPGIKISWRFRVPDFKQITFQDRGIGAQNYVAGSDFGDFIVWRHDDLPSYQLACVVDDAAMQITEVVRGSDLLISTARQILLFNALGLQLPAFFHCPLLTDERGLRLAKRHDAQSLRELRRQGKKPTELRQVFHCTNFLLTARER